MRLLRWIKERLGRKGLVVLEALLCLAAGVVLWACWDYPIPDPEAHLRRLERRDLLPQGEIIHQLDGLVLTCNRVYMLQYDGYIGLGYVESLESNRASSGWIDLFPALEAQATPVQINGTIGQKMGEETVWGRGALAVGMPEGARWAELTYTRSEGGETVTVTARGEAYEGDTFYFWFPEQESQPLFDYGSRLEYSLKAYGQQDNLLGQTTGQARNKWW